MKLKNIFTALALLTVTSASAQITTVMSYPRGSAGASLTDTLTITDTLVVTITDTLSLPPFQECGTTAVAGVTVTNAPADALTLLTFSAPSGVVEFEPVGTIDPAPAVSTLDARLINDIYTDLLYNNSSAGSTNKALPAVDLGAVVSPSYVSLYWWSLNYLPASAVIESSVDGVTWVAASGVFSGTWLGPSIPQNINVSGAGRYWRLFTFTGVNATWITLSEQEMFATIVAGTTNDHESGALVLGSNGVNVTVINTSAVELEWCLEWVEP